MLIKSITGREIFDSRGTPTIECELVLDDAITVSASVPSGLSRSIFEAVEIRDGGKRLFGQGVLKAIGNLEDHIAQVLVNQRPDVVTLDTRMLELDNSEDKSRLGGNAMLAASMAVCRAQAIEHDVELYELIALLLARETISLPLPMFNVINGGMHGSRGLAVQEFMVVPIAAPRFSVALEAGIVAAREVRNILHTKGMLAGYGDEGGAYATFSQNEEALDVLQEAIDKTQKQIPGVTLMIALDVAASSFFDATTQKYKWNDALVDAGHLIKWYEKIALAYPLYALEDGLAYSDWSGWQALQECLGNKVHLIGDDIYATHADRVWQAIEQELKTGVVLKPNQVGTITETLQTAKLCLEHDLPIVVSHRSGETNDSFIADLAVGAGASYIKAGAPFHGERLAKYLRLVEIEEALLWQLCDENEEQDLD